jgi:hypothetical protein
VLTPILYEVKLLFMKPPLLKEITAGNQLSALWREKWYEFPACIIFVYPAIHSDAGNREKYSILYALCPVLTGQSNVEWHI